MADVLPSIEIQADTSQKPKTPQIVVDLQREAYREKIADLQQRDVVKTTELDDVTRQLRQQAELLNQANDAIMLSGLDDIIQYWNTGAQRLYGWKAEEAMGKNQQEFLFATSAEYWAEINRSFVEKGEWKGEITKKKKDGSLIVVESHWTIVRNDDGSPRGKLVISTDITERKESEAQHLRAQRLEGIGSLAGGIAHDLNNILTPVMMAADLLEYPMNQDQYHQLVKTLQTSAKRGADLIRQILTFSRGSEGERIPTDLRLILADLQQMLSHSLPKNIQLNTKVDANLWMVLGNATQVSQILLNLAVNARDAMPQGGQLSIELHNTTLDENYARMDRKAKPGNYVEMLVADTGEGVSTDIRDKIFDPFFTTKEPGKGTGLGLSTVHSIAEAHGGFVQLSRECEKETCFRVYLPATADGKPQPLKEAVNAPLGRGELVLIVDDEKAIREIVKMTIESHGYKAIEAQNGAEAVALYALRKADVRLVLCDMMMPLMDGEQTIYALHSISPEVAVIATSGLKGSENIAHAHIREKAFLQKPYTAQTLLLLIRRILDEVQAAQTKE